MKKKYLIFALWSGLIACHPHQQVIEPNDPETVSPHSLQGLKIANPASVFCHEQGGVTQIVTDSSGGQAGYCQLPDGRVIDEWELFRHPQLLDKVPQRLEN